MNKQCFPDPFIFLECFLLATAFYSDFSKVILMQLLFKCIIRLPIHLVYKKLKKSQSEVFLRLNQESWTYVKWVPRRPFLGPLSKTRLSFVSPGCC